MFTFFVSAFLKYNKNYHVLDKKVNKVIVEGRKVFTAETPGRKDK